MIGSYGVALCCYQERFCFSLIIILPIWEFFTPVLADGFPLESEWQQVSSSLQDSS